jgi:hypothetical protein
VTRTLLCYPCRRATPFMAMAAAWSECICWQK